VSAIPGREALQPERTALAWQRTAVTALVAQAPMVLVALRSDQPVLTALGAAAMTAGAVLVFSVRRRLGQLGDDDHAYSPGTLMVQAASVTVLASVGGSALGLVVWLR
jgi:uncharacterized membrane protein YidH (DUF202 family)